MKAIVKVISILSLGMFISLAACTSENKTDGTGTEVDSMGMDRSGSEMGADTMTTDTAGTSL
ncbi:hypothetical protein [Dyadobacter fanqingshengii]|uniref:Entericidin n=1 Tax=Dyadobacter fanqingshengii TaxID=2906443 RepID=A0A9X1P7V0_9BACT|nr:hypothetical protein [Dyadobacter fanqingshengii]MCF0040404.1 hypothetical protein [Dyadobacter fanqingshengii]MCF2501994.1 hypothetical protein [Dyadobacter fanqingshengii]USJ37854.1 hypothetical protein NFI81_08710 [Dyadobacter fanqingshengii]